MLDRQLVEQPLEPLATLRVPSGKVSRIARTLSSTLSLRNTEGSWAR